MAYTSDDEDMDFPRHRVQHPDAADDMDMSSDAESDEEEVDEVGAPLRWLGATTHAAEQYKLRRS